MGSGVFDIHSFQFEKQPSVSGPLQTSSSRQEPSVGWLLTNSEQAASFCWCLTAIHSRQSREFSRNRGKLEKTEGILYLSDINKNTI